MAERLTQTVLSFLVVLAAYWLYALFIVPRIDPAAAELNSLTRGATSVETHEPSADERPTDRFRSLLEPLFAPDSWELNQAMVLKNDQFILLVHEYKTLGKGDQLKLTPCTVVLNPTAIRDQNTDQTCVILKAPEGAILEFDRPFSISTGGLGKLVGGQLNGKVTIQSHARSAKEGPASDRPVGDRSESDGQMVLEPLEVVTSNVQMNSQQIWTPDLVRFRYGASHGAGRDLMINLTEVETSDLRRLPNDRPTHLRSLELVQLDELTVTTRAASSLTGSSPVDPTTLRIHCKGPLLFDFVGGSVTLQDQVAIQRLNVTSPNGNSAISKSAGRPDAKQENDRVAKSDWLTCDTLAMQFRALGQPHPSTDNDHAQGQEPSWALPKFELTQISAMGSPAVIDAPTYQVRAQAERIELHLSHNRVLLRDASEAILQYDLHTFRAPQMRYYVDPQGGPGRAEVDGGGQYVGAMQDDVVQLLWRDSLTFGPRDGRYLLDVSGRTHIQWGKRSAKQPARGQRNDGPHAADQADMPSSTMAPGNGLSNRSDSNGGHASLGPTDAPLENRLTAGQLRLWLRARDATDQRRLRPVRHDEPVAPEWNRTNTTGLSPPTATPPTAVQPTTIPVEQIHKAWTPDKLVARQTVRLRTPQLAADVEFAEIELQDEREEGAAAGDDQITLNGPALPAPTMSLAGPFGAAHQPANGLPTKYQMTAHDVRIVLQNNRSHSATPEFKSVRIHGDVRLLQTKGEGVGTTTSQPNEPELDVQGTQVLLEQTGAGAIGSIVGTPAVVRTKGVEVTGESIHVDQSQNRVWIDSAGNAYLPLPESVAARFGRKTATMQVAWKGTMNFDGQSVTCNQGVEIRGPAQIATAEGLRVTLVEPIRLDTQTRSSARRTRMPERPQQVVAQVGLTGNVWLENRSFDDHGLASIDEFRVHSLVYDQTTEQLVGEGPGQMSSKRYVASQSSFDKTRHEEPRLTHTLIVFQKQLHGRLPKREVSVFDRVQAIHGPIVDWNQEIRFDAATQSPETVMMRASRLTVAQMGTDRQPSLEFAASGNTEIRGQTFVANAQHVRYAQAKDMLVLEGEGRSVASLSHQSRVGAARQTLSARKIQYWIGSDKVNFEDVVFGDVTSNSARSPAPALTAAPQSPTRNDPRRQTNFSFSRQAERVRTDSVPQVPQIYGSPASPNPPHRNVTPQGGAPP